MRIDEHARRHNGQRFIAPCDLCDGVLDEDAHQGVGGGNPAVHGFGDAEIGVGVNGHEDPEHGGGDETDCHQGDECHVAFIAEDARVPFRALGLGRLKNWFLLTLMVLSSVSCARKKSSRL